MEIKVGDKVRVSKDAPRIYTQNCLNLSLHNTDFEVANIEDGCANIQNKDGILTIAYVIPTKYLTKVENEAKEPKFKVGEIVRYRYDGKLYIVECKTGKYYYALRQVGGDIMMHDVLESDLELVTEPKQGIKVGDVIDTPDGKGTVRSSYGDYWVAQLDNGEWYIHMETNMPYAPYTEPTSPTIKIGDFVRVLENPHAPLLLRHGKTLGKYHTYEVTVDTVAMDWQHYEADLAKEIALKVANKYSDPAEAADYAVSVAKAVVENLKRK